MLCYEFMTFIRCMKAAFYRLDFQKFLMCPLNKRLGRAFVSKHAAKPLKHSAKLSKQSAEHLKHSAELLEAEEKTKSSTECLKSSAACLCYNMAHAVPTSHGNTVVD